MIGVKEIRRIGVRIDAGGMAGELPGRRMLMLLSGGPRSDGGCDRKRVRIHG